VYHHLHFVTIEKIAQYFWFLLNTIKCPSHSTKSFVSHVRPHDINNNFRAKQQAKNTQSWPQVFSALTP
jgi:hypothetical protein